MAELTLQDRIKKNQDYKKILKKGNKIHGRYLKLSYLPSNNLVTRIGIAVGKRHGNAVKRNYFKRIIRESLRKNKNTKSYPIDIVITLKKVDKKTTYHKIYEEIQMLLKKSVIK